MPADLKETSPSLTVLAHVCGWTYFSAWTLSFYPQLLMNYRWKTTKGLSTTFALFNLIGFVALAVYDLIRYHIQGKHNLATAVEIQDVCFALHAVVLCVIVLGQILYYDHKNLLNKMSIPVFLIATFLVLIGALHIIAVQYKIIPLTLYPSMPTGDFTISIWSFTNYCAAVKLGITLFKYIPQILLNFQRQMTNGLAIWTFNLDCVGGVFSLLQNGIEAVNKHNGAYITGNVPKIAIGLVGLTYNGIILSQHYILYKEHNLLDNKGDTDILSGNLTTLDDDDGDFRFTTT